MRTPGRALFTDLDEHTWPNFLENLLSDENFLCERKIQGGQQVVAPNWNACLEYEFQLRKQACRLIRESYKPIGSALQGACDDPQHRMTRWISLLHMTNNRKVTNTCEVAMLKKRLAAFERSQNRPSKSRKGNQSYDEGHGSKGRGKGKGKQNNFSKGTNGGKGAKKGNKGSSSQQKGSGAFKKSTKSPGQAQENVLSRQRPRTRFHLLQVPTTSRLRRPGMYTSAHLCGLWQDWSLHTTTAAVSMPSYDKQMCSMKNR